MSHSMQNIINRINNHIGGQVGQHTVHGDQAFYLQNGTSLHSLHDLKRELHHMSEELYQYHVTEEKNDFANWVHYVFNEPDLAEELRKTQSRSQALTVLENAI